MIEVLNGVNGQLELYNDKVIIKRKGALAKMIQGFFKGDKTIYIKQISGIQIKLGGTITNGYIQFTLSGSNESTKGIFNASQEENTVMYSKDSNKQVERMKVTLEELQMKSNTVVVSSVGSPADEIRKFKELMDQGIITAEEFEFRKKQLLGI
ncbi:hypothetical protein PMSD_20685 [Paenibacillus macquariensis subsp. defensor]|nr:hypothetical protein PMSD_20685 [Paenibacillus macquariensis subsp. defensor]